MTRERVVRVTCYYRDASLLEMVVSTFRKLLIDVEWIYGRKVGKDGLYEIVLGVKDSWNFNIAILDLSKTVNVEMVEVIGDPGEGNYVTTEVTGNAEVVKIYIPKNVISECYSWGEICG